MIAAGSSIKAVKSGIKPKTVPTVTKALKQATWKATKKVGTKVGWPILKHYGPELLDDMGFQNTLQAVGDQLGSVTDPMYHKASDF